MKYNPDIHRCCSIEIADASMGKGDGAIVGDFEVTKSNDVGFTSNRGRK